MLIEAIKGGQLARLIDVAADRIEVAQERTALADLIERDARGRAEVGNAEWAGGRRIDTGLERLVSDAQIRRIGPGHLARNHHIAWQLQAQMAELPGNDSAAGRINILVGIGAGVVAGKANL